MEVVQGVVGNLDAKAADCGRRSGFDGAMVSPLVIRSMAAMVSLVAVNICPHWGLHRKRCPGKALLRRRGRAVRSQRSPRKNALTSSVNPSGFSIARKCPPRSNSVQWTTLWSRLGQPPDGDVLGERDGHPGRDCASFLWRKGVRVVEVLVVEVRRRACGVGVPVDADVGQHMVAPDGVFREAPPPGRSTP